MLMQKSNSIKIVLPIYYTIKYKTKKNKTILVGLNWYRNAHFITSNDVKHYFHKLIGEQNINKKFKTLIPEYHIYVRASNTDGPNIRSILEKFVLDGLKEYGIIEDDNITIIKGDSSKYFIDKENPRIEIFLKEE